jgi:hypothetical protein
VERELFPHSTDDTERSLHHDQAKMAMRACASMKQLDQVGRIEEDTARAAGSAMKQRVLEAMPGTQEGQRRRRGAVVDGDVEMGVDTRMEAQGHCNQHEDNRYGAESTGRDTTHVAATAGMCVGADDDSRGDQQPCHGSQPSSFREKLLFMFQAELDARGLKRKPDLEVAEEVAKRAVSPFAAMLEDSGMSHKTAFRGWTTALASSANELAAAAALVSAVAAHVQSLKVVDADSMAALHRAGVTLTASASTRAAESRQVARTAAEAANSVEAGGAAASEIMGLMAEELLMVAMKEASDSAAVCGEQNPASDGDEGADEEPEWLREAAAKAGLGVRAAEPGQRARAALKLQCLWRYHKAKCDLRTRAAAARASADGAREERRRAARERLAVREAEERVAKTARRHAERRRATSSHGSNATTACGDEKQRGGAEVACAARQHGTALPILRLAKAVERLQSAWRQRVERRFLPTSHTAPGPYIVPAALGQTRLASSARRSGAACKLQVAWRACIARRCAAQRVRAAVVTVAVQNRVATVQAFRQLEAELRVQGIRVASGAASGGRQRARLREQRRREQIAERLWQGTWGR